MKPTKRKRFVLGIDDRIPSKIAASILRNQDYDLVGVHLRIDLGGDEELYPSAMHKANLESIEKACSALGIPLKVIDVTDETIAKVYDPYWIATLEGKVDYPKQRWLKDVLLTNLFSVADQIGAEGVTTGHFARRMNRIIRYPDLDLDQSLAFATVPADLLSRLLLPIGEVSPEMVVRLSRELGTIAKDDRDFDGAKGLRALHADRKNRGVWEWDRKVLDDPRVKARAEGDFFKRGPIRSVQEFTVGDHEGIPFYTVGSRAPGDNPDQFVIEIQPQSRTIIIGPMTNLLTTGAYLKDLNWTDEGVHPYRARRALVRSIREDGVETGAGIIEYPGKIAEIRYDTPLSGISVGQTLVFLEESQVLGSGTVIETKREMKPEKPVEKGL